MQHFSRIRTFMLELDAGRGPGVAYRGGELLSGRVVLDVAKGLKVRALAVCARGLAATHWLESKSFGMNTVYSDYTAYETYLRRRQHLIRVIIFRNLSGTQDTKPGAICTRMCKHKKLFLRFD
ncbi:hypothetical protein E2320_021885 [Naja naja]|nr:hypothetical protein E2320_021885 [Naja naja]